MYYFKGSLWLSGEQVTSPDATAATQARADGSSNSAESSQILDVVGWPKSSFGFFLDVLRKTQTNFLVSPIFGR